jgi:hypothetical protein
LQTELRKIAAKAQEVVVANYDPKITELLKGVIAHFALRPEIINYGEWIIKNMHADIEKSLQAEDKAQTEDKYS